MSVISVMCANCVLNDLHGLRGRHPSPRSLGLVQEILVVKVGVVDGGGSATRRSIELY